LAYLNSDYGAAHIEVVSPTVNKLVGDIISLPIPERFEEEEELSKLSVRRVEIARKDWNAAETATDYQGKAPGSHVLVSQRVAQALQACRDTRDKAKSLELQIELVLARTFQHSADVEVLEPTAISEPFTEVEEFVSLSVGCMTGRYSLQETGVVLADQGDTFDTFMERVPNATFLPDRDNVIPLVDGDWFEDDIVARFREWLNVAFGPEHLHENWRYIEHTLGKTIRQYFVKDFYTDHVKRYKKRPIYWLFSSPKGTFNALIYMHRYTPATVGTVLHDYALPFLTKLETELGKQEHLAAAADTPRAAAAATKQAETLRKQILEVRQWATDVLHPLADQQIEIDLDDGVKHNYPRFGTALKKITGLEASNE
jgi:hypothetical protein